MYETIAANSSVTAIPIGLLTLTPVVPQQIFVSSSQELASPG